jgi:hypothetical protein
VLAGYLRPALPRPRVLYLMAPMVLYGTEVLEEAREYPYADLTGCPVEVLCAEDLYRDNAEWAALWPVVRKRADCAVFLDHLNGWVARGVRVEADGLLALGKPVWWFCGGQPTDRFGFGPPDFADWRMRHCRVGLGYQRPVRSAKMRPIQAWPPGGGV